jgi:hypothetical protein
VPHLPSHNGCDTTTPSLPVQNTQHISPFTV